MHIIRYLCSLLCVLLLLLFGCKDKSPSNNNMGTSTGHTTGYTPTAPATPSSRSHGGTVVVVTPGSQQPSQGQPPGQSQQPGQGTDGGQQSPAGGQVHIFKYSGREFCGHELTSYDPGISVDAMKVQLIQLGIRIHSSYKSEDGKEYPNEDCGEPSGSINVYVIDRSNLQKAESSGGFCECTPKQQEVICTPYEYATPPSSGCR